MKTKILILLFIISIGIKTNCYAQGCSVTINSPVATICMGSCVTLTASATGTPPFTYLWTPSMETSSTITVCPLVPTTYTVTVEDFNHCISSASTIIIVNPLPVVTVGPPISICSGECLHLTASSGGISYLWTPSTCLSSSNIPDPFFCCPPGTYIETLIVTDMNGCTNSATTTITVNALPVATVSPDTVICYGQYTSLSSSGGITCAWSPSMGLSSTTGCIVYAIATTTTTYTVTVTDGNGCKDTAQTKVTVNTCTNVNNISEDNAMSFYPNPTKGIFYISLTKTIKSGELTIFNIMGEKVYSEVIKGRREVQVILKAAAGVYFVQVRNENEVARQKIVIE